MGATGRSIENKTRRRLLNQRELDATQTNVGLMLDQRHRRWPNIKSTLVQGLVFASAPWLPIASGEPAESNVKTKP